MKYSMYLHEFVFIKFIAPEIYVEKSELPLGYRWFHVINFP